MQTWLVLQDPGGSPSYPLDPYMEPLRTVGRSARCDIVVNDHRASRHHADIRWNGRRWELVDRGSTNGTYVNGKQVYQPCELQIGDRVTLGETTLVLREASAQPAASPWSPSAGDAVEAWERPVPPQAARPAAYHVGGPVPRPVEGHRPTSAAATVAFWLVQALVAAAVVCLAAGALLPWLRVAGSLSQDLEPLLQGIANIVSIFSGPNSILNMTQEIDGLEGYGKLTLAIALVGLLTLVLDIVFHQRSTVPGVVYLVSGLIASGAIAFDLVNYYRFYNQMQDLSLLFGVRLDQVVQVFDQFLDVQITPMIGLVLTGAGLLLLLAGGIGRLGVALLDQSR